MLTPVALAISAVLQFYLSIKAYQQAKEDIQDEAANQQNYCFQNTNGLFEELN